MSKLIALHPNEACFSLSTRCVPGGIRRYTGQGVRGPAPPTGSRVASVDHPGQKGTALGDSMGFIGFRLTGSTGLAMAGIGCGPRWLGITEGGKEAPYCINIPRR